MLLLVLQQQKYWLQWTDKEYMSLSLDQKRILAAALKREKSLKMDECIDPANLDSRPSPPQQRIIEDYERLHIYVVAGNQSGKSQVGGRIVAWKFMDNHPYWNRRPEWGDEPLLIIVSGRLGDQVEELWEKKIRPFLPAGSYNKPQRSGPVLKSVTHKTNGNKIIFTSHDKANVSWEKIQSYVAHHIWIDEMPSHYKYLEEAHRRVDARQGQCMVTMTPKSKNEKIRQMVDNVDPRVGIKYMMGKLDNPIYKGREEIEIAKLATYSEEERNCILYGHWMQGEEAVFNFLRSDHVKELPPSYSCGWPHVLAFDPAGGGLGGLVIAARDPATHYWYIVKAQYIEGKAPSDLVDEVRNIAAPYNIVRKIYDTHENWFTSEAIKQGYGGWIAVEKHNRKKELITGLQQALLDKWLFCVPNLNKLYEEFRNAEWLDMDEMKIRNSSKYHLLDAIQYMVDNLPRVAEERVNLTRDQAIIKAHEETLAAEAAAKKAKAAESHRKQFKVGSPRFRRKRW
jgi:phage terminase large subunit-like protein